MWKKIKDELPPAGENVLAIMHSGRMDVLEMNQYQDLFSDLCGNWNIKTEYVRYWSLLPDPPMEF